MEAIHFPIMFRIKLNLSKSRLDQLAELGRTLKGSPEDLHCYQQGHFIGEGLVPGDAENKNEALKNSGGQQARYCARSNQDTTPLSLIDITQKAWHLVFVLLGISVSLGFSPARRPSKAGVHSSRV